MALYDDYFRNEDKPFAENLNDALLLSNVFDLTVPIEAPRMFSNSTWVDNTSTRKCGVSLLTLKEGLPTGVTVATDSQTGDSVLTGTGTVELSIYPNFNSFGKYESFTWENTGSIVVNLKTTAGTTIASNISKGVIQSQSSELRTLQEIVVEFVFTDATLQSFGFVMANKDQERYGATVGIDDVTGLDDELSDMTDLIDTKVAKSDIVDNLTSTDTNKPLSAKQGKELKTLITNIDKNGTIDTFGFNIFSQFFSREESIIHSTIRNGIAIISFSMKLINPPSTTTRLYMGAVAIYFKPSHLVYNTVKVIDNANMKIGTVSVDTSRDVYYEGESINTGAIIVGSVIYPINDY